MIGWNRHLNDDRLFEYYLGERGIEPVNFRAAEHLDDCARCRERYTALIETMDDVRVNADLDTDTVFTPERLDAQRHAIARRVAALNYSARVLAFPNQSPPASVTAMRFAPRWLAAAAAAGLFVGVGVGVFFDARARGFRPAMATVVPVAAPASNPTPGPTPAAQAAAPKTETAPATAVPVSDPDLSDDDAAFMAELQMAFERPGARELMAMDALTPRVRDISFAPR